MAVMWRHRQTTDKATINQDTSQKRRHRTLRIYDRPDTPSN